ncbi:hypothetical protein B0H13DRAFT_2338113 [Mycena leptocephala]|nr:hypothetical protein B0H13DRAFT_2338113 [Mycena leptocephala]
MSASSAAAASKTTPAKNAAPSPRASISTSASIGATAACPKECIATSDAPTRQGVSRHAIKKFAADKYKLNTSADVSHLKHAIIVGVDGGFFVQPKFTFISVFGMLRAAW